MKNNSTKKGTFKWAVFAVVLVLSLPCICHARQIGQTDCSSTIDAEGGITGVPIGAFAVLDAPASTTITTAGVFYPIQGAFTNEPFEGFEAATVYTPGIKYIGEQEQYLIVHWNAAVEADKLNTNVTCAIAREGVVCEGARMTTRCFTADELYSFSGTCVALGTPNSEIQLVVTSNGSGDVITFDNFTTSIQEFFD